MISSTAVISIGGDMFIDSWSEPPIYALESIEFAQFLGCKTIVFGASIWPFKTKWLQMRVKIMLEHCNLVTVRDDPTYNFLSSIGVESNVRKVSDGAFLMLPRHSEQTKVNWSSPEKKIVGFNGSPLFYSQLSHEEANKMLSSMIKFFTHIIDKQDCNIILVPHDAYPAPAEWHFLFEMKELINRPNNIYLPPLGLDAREMKALLGQSDVFIGMRFHSTIAALSQSIPTIGLSYSPKFTGLHKEVYGHVDFLIPYKDVTFKILCSKFKRIQENKTNIIQSLDKRIQILQKQALQNGAYIKTLLDQDA